MGNGEWKEVLGHHGMGAWRTGGSRRLAPAEYHHVGAWGGSPPIEPEIFKFLGPFKKIVFSSFGPLFGFPGPRGPRKSNRHEKLPPGYNFQPLRCPGARLMAQKNIFHILSSRFSYKTFFFSSPGPGTILKRFLVPEYVYLNIRIPLKAPWGEFHGGSPPMRP